MCVRTCLAFSLFLLIGSFSASFAGTNYHLDGYMGVQGGESFHYVIDLKDSTGNLLSGYAYTYKNESNAVKARVLAVIDRTQKTLRIQEQGIIYNNGFESKVTICLVNALLKWDTAAGNLSGSLITETTDNGSTCSTGSIVFYKKNQINQLFAALPPPKLVVQKNAETQAGGGFFKLKENPNQKLHTYFEKLKVEEQQTAVKPVVKTQQNPEVVARKPFKEVKEITEGNAVTYNWQSDQVIFEIWDGGEIDNDRVKVAFNGNTVLPDYTLKAEKKQLVFRLIPGKENIITITANNEGVIPPNTANILLSDGGKNYSVLAYNKAGKAAIIKIKKI